MVTVAQPLGADQWEVIDFLSAPAAYRLPPQTAVERAETHGALVFLAGARAYKLKRAVKYPYLDYSTVDLRRAACLKELEVNRPMAPDLYLDVRAVVRDQGGQLRLGDAGATDRAVDWLVVMRRFAQADLFEEMRKAGRLTPALLRAVAEIVADFHISAALRPAYGGAAAMAGIVEGNLKLLESMTDVFDQAQVDRLARLSRAALDRVGVLLDRRRAQGRVRRCHGDLHLNNICLFDGRPMLFDAIEFDESFASIDVFYDLAFLIMDLDRHGSRAFANLVLNRYLELTLDYEGLAALPLFLSCRAAIRAHVRVTRVSAAQRPEAVLAARALLDRAIAYLEPLRPRLFAIGGASGTGKTTIARGFAPAVGPCPGAVVIRSDVTRKRMMGGDEMTKLPESAYTAPITDKVFDTMAHAAAEVLAGGHAVVMDAVYGDPGQRADIEEVARRARVRFGGFWLEAPSPVLEERVTARTADASDATAAVLRAQITRLRRPPGWTPIDAARPPAEIVAELCRHSGIQAAA